jgi:triacylglycerol lipase
MGQAILLIHGFAGNKKDYSKIINYLKKKGFRKFYKFSYEKSWGQVSIKDIAKQLSLYVKEKIHEKSFDIIGLSQGGVIALNYLKNYNTKTVKKLFTVCSPHNGTLIAYLWFTQGFLDLRPNSSLLNELKKFRKYCKTEIFTIYTPFDLVVFPGINAKVNNNNYKKVYSLSHKSAFYCNSTLKFISENLINK